MPEITRRFTLDQNENGRYENYIVSDAARIVGSFRIDKDDDVITIYDDNDFELSEENIELSDAGDFTKRERRIALNKACRFLDQWLSDLEPPLYEVADDQEWDV